MSILSPTSGTSGTKQKLYKPEQQSACFRLVTRVKGLTKKSEVRKRWKTPWSWWLCRTSCIILTVPALKSTVSIYTYKAQELLYLKPRLCHVKNIAWIIPIGNQLPRLMWSWSSVSFTLIFFLCVCCSTCTSTLLKEASSAVAIKEINSSPQLNFLGVHGIHFPNWNGVHDFFMASYIFLHFTEGILDLYLYPSLV